MSNRKQRMPADKSGQTLAYRIGKAEIGDPDKPLRMVLATENPVRVFDYAEWEVVDEVLRMDGLSFSSQVPLLNSHDRGEARSVIGSIRDLKVSDDRLEGQAYFASSEEAQDIRGLYDDGHLTDFSIGFQPDEVKRLKRGESMTINGRTYRGPLRIVTKATAKEGSAVAIGADDQAKVLREFPALRAYVFPDECAKEHNMNAIRQYALVRGMPADTADEDVEQWMNDNLVTKNQRQAEEVIVTEEPAGESDRVRDAKITRMCMEHGISPRETEAFIASDMSSGDVAEVILKRKALEKQGETTGPSKEPPIRHIDSEDDKFYAGARGALLNRCLMGVNLDDATKHAEGVYRNNGNEITTYYRNQSSVEGIAEVKQLIASPVGRDMRNMGLFEIAQQFVRRDAFARQGYTHHDVTFGLSRTEVVKRAFEMDLHRRGDAAYHTTSSFANLLLDAAKKTLLAAYEEANVTYPVWTRMAPSTADFKTINRIRFGEIPDPQIVAENAPYSDAAVSDNKETYRVEKYGNIFSISLEAVVNDDLNAISRIPAQQGAAMRRKINKVVYSVLTANAALSDGVALFHASSHGANLDAVALGIGSLNTGWTVMALQTGLTTGVILNIQPRFLIVPAALGYTALQLVGSIADPSNTSGSTEDASRPNFNSGTLNVYGPNGSRPLTPVIEGQLDGTSATGWYLAASPSQIDTVEVCFLQGEETPYLERQDGFEVDAIKYKIRQTFGAKAVDYRGLYQGNS